MAEHDKTDRLVVTARHEVLRLEGTGEWVAEAFSDEDDEIVMRRVRRPAH